MIEIGTVTFNKELVDKLIQKGFEEDDEAQELVSGAESRPAPKNKA
jgi:hypothetical protein|tara:strand:- start:348 stop:485 length:138 start_codon:yes stop_codon:yes gene_type:complete